MKKISFKWNNCIHSGTILSQTPSPIQGQRTVVQVDKPLNMEFTMYGKCEVGNCGPFTVLSIT